MEAVMDKIGIERYPAYKDSGVEGLGEVPTHWEVIKLKYLLAERSERSKTGEEQLLMISQVHGLVIRSDFHAKTEVAQSTIGNKLVYENDLVFNKLKAHLGVFFKSEIRKPSIVSPDYAVYYPIGILKDMKFLEFLFRHPAYINQFICRATGIVEGLIRLYTKDLFYIKVAVPPEEEQYKILKFIIEKIKKIERAIAQKEKLIELLKERRQILIHKAVTRGLDPNVKMKDSGVEWIGEKPEHWEVKRLGLISNVIDPQPDHRAPKIDENGLPYLGIRDINEDGTINVNTARMVDEAAIKKQESSFTLKDGDIVFCKVGTLGEPKHIKLDGVRVALSATLVIVQIENTAVSKYVKFVLDCDFITKQINQIVTGATRPALGIQQIRKFQILIPPMGELKELVSYLEYNSEKISTACSMKEREIEKLKEYKAALVNAAVTGKIKVN